MEDEKKPLFLIIGSPPITAFGYHDLLPKLLFTERNYEIPTVGAMMKQGKSGYFAPDYWAYLPTRQEQVEEEIKSLTLKTNKDMEPDYISSTRKSRYGFDYRNSFVREPEFDLEKFLETPEPFLGRTGTISTYDPDTINKKQLKAKRKKAKRAKKARRKNKT